MSLISPNALQRKGKTCGRTKLVIKKIFDLKHPSLGRDPADFIHATSS
jgi:hypothetical protein